MMRRFSLSAVAIVLAWWGYAFAQQRLVLHNDQNDSCRRFKMRILIPADEADRELPVKRFAGGVDSKMVWNPCATDTQQIAVAPSIQPQGKSGLFSQFPSSAFKEGAKDKPEPGAFLLNQPRFTLPRVWRRP